jgi:hypothetical protein
MWDSKSTVLPQRTSRTRKSDRKTSGTFVSPELCLPRRPRSFQDLWDSSKTHPRGIAMFWQSVTSGPRQDLDIVALCPN